MVEHRYKTQTKSNKANNVIIHSDSVNNFYKTIVSSNTKGKTFNYITEWKIKNSNQYMLNPSLAVNVFTNTLNSNKSFKQKIANKKVELNIDSIPSIFAVITEQGSFQIFYNGDIAVIQPCSCTKNMIISYKITSQDSSYSRTGKIIIPDVNQTVHIKSFQTLEGKMIEYLEQYDAAIATMTKLFADKLSAKL
ncbi:MAG TPA: hypothetical protein VHP12_01145 [Chitinophagaceae bacterium]|nr:hypothetical protein [Chitinophagaceae bacterium]